MTDPVDDLSKKIDHVSFTTSDDSPTNSPARDMTVVGRLVNKKLLETCTGNKDKLSIFQNDPNNPLYSVNSFKDMNLPEKLLQGIHTMGFIRPSKIQSAALPQLIGEVPSNMIAQSQSGTGKTACFLLTCLYRIDATKNYPQAMVVCPTYELALQTADVCRQMGQFIEGLQVRNVVRGETLERNTRLTEQILIGTPGKMIDWGLKHRFFDISKLVVFVLDEADVLIDMQSMRAQSLQLKERCPPNCQSLFFSATFSNEILDFAEKIVAEPYYILAVEQKQQSLDNIKQYYIEVLNEDQKFEALKAIYSAITIGQTFVFVETKVSAHRLVERLRQDGHAVGLISGDLSVEERNDVINRFREAKERVLVATNVMARGIDVEQVTLVVNYDLPLTMNKEVDFDTYLHRIGRTGRFGKEGLAINFADSMDAKQKIDQIEQHFGKPITLLDATDFDAIERIAGEPLQE